MLEGALKTIAVSMANCEFYASVFSEALDKQFTSPGTTAAWERQLETALPEFYATVLVFFIKVKGYFIPSTMGKFDGPSH
jgi:leucyl-tRNA synthetase